MRRREVIIGFGTATMAGVMPVTAQRAKRLPVVGFVLSAPPVIGMTGPDPVNPPARGLVHGLRDLGWIDGRNISIERRSAESDPRRAPAIIDELIARGVDVIMLGGARWLHDAAQAATRTIPTVALFAEDPVVAGLITSLARPGGNLTGVAVTTGPDFHGKQLQILAELVPRITRAAFIAPQGVVKQFLGVAHPAGVMVVPATVDVPEQYTEAFATVVRERADALIASGGAVNYVHHMRIVTFAAEKRLPTIFGDREAVEAGGLAAYGASLSGAYRQAARLVAGFLSGARLGEIPTEQVATFELVINAKTAKALGLTIPPTLLAFATEVLE
jgi:putative tryptophan/tyrosine transport system substrate-binding protein